MTRHTGRSCTLLAVALVVGFAVTPTTTHTNVAPRRYLHDVVAPGLVGLAGEACTDACEVTEQPSGEAGAWDESPTIPTAAWEATNGPLTLAVEVRPPSPRVGEVAKVRVVATLNGQRPLSAALAFGEERPQRNGRVVLHCSSALSPDGGRAPATATRKTSVREVRFNAPGPQRVRALGRAHGCDGGVDVEVSGLVTVRPSRLPTNGPLRPVAAVSSGSALRSFPPDRYIELVVRGEDGDGYLRRLEIDWGDGSLSEEVGGEANPCARSPVAAPTAIPPTLRAHVYTRDGTYTVTVTAVSSGCDGRTRQTGRARYAVSVSAG